MTCLRPQSESLIPGWSPDLSDSNVVWGKVFYSTVRLVKMQVLGRLRTKIRLNIKEDIRYFLVCIEGGGGRENGGRKRKKEEKKEKQAVLKLEALGFGEKRIFGRIKKRAQSY